MQNDQKTKQELKKRKEEIRAKHRKAFADTVEIVSADERNWLIDEDKPLRFAIYPPVSTDETPQSCSYEFQKRYYEEMEKGNPATADPAEGE